MEKTTNPFLRFDLPQLAAATGLKDAMPASVFAAIREANDNIKG